MAFVLGLGLIIAMSSFKAAIGKPTLITYHIVQDLGNRYEVTTDGECIGGDDPSVLESNLTPDSNGEITKAALLVENPSYEEEITQGSFVGAQ